ncbi:MAG: PrgI family protein [Patescibacteria group bacterium]|nr:PrgI family protein [Patescibacteria group bacterium]
MATFQIPQFIEQKPKIIGPLTLPQFLYLAAAGGMSFASFYIFNFFFGLIVTAILVGAAIALAFVKINGQGLPKILQSAFSYLWRPRTYIWQRAVAQTVLDISELEKLKDIRSKMSIQEKLKSITLNITTGKIFSPKKLREEQKDRYRVVTHLTGEREVAKNVDY